MMVPRRILLTAFLRRLRRDTAGSPSVEFALLLPVLMALALGALQFGLALNNYLTLTNATISGNYALGGGGIALAAFASATLTNATVAGNSSIRCLPRENGAPKVNRRSNGRQRGRDGTGTSSRGSIAPMRAASAGGAR